MFSLDVTQADFEEKVIAASFKQPVVMDFWAPWCGPCKVLKPLLEKLAAEYGGKFLLAKVNSDENPDLSAQFGVRGIPTVKAVVNGKVVNEFTGALPEGRVRAWLEKIFPSPAEEYLRVANQKLLVGELDGVMELLAQASALEPNNEWVRVTAAEVMLARGEQEEAKVLLDSLKQPDVLKDPRVLRLQAQARLQQNNSGEDEAALHARIESNADDLEARLALANVLVSSQRYAEGMDQLLEIVRRDRTFQDDIARKTLLDVFNLLTGQGGLVSEYRRKLASALN